MSKRRIAGEAEILRTIEAAASAILKDCADVKQMALVGIQTRGVPLSLRIAKEIEKKTGVAPKLALLDINFYRDDLSTVSEQPILKKTEIPFSIDGLHLILVDDVLYTGRTIRAALDALVDFGRPAKVRLFVLVDRGGRELPIEANWRGLTEEVKPGQVVEVRLKECDKEEGIFIV